MEEIIFGAVFLILGTVIGSFLNVVIWRLPRGEDIFGRSVCPHCKNKLKPSYLVPVLSYVFLRGRCGFCRKPVSLRYPIIEISTGLLFLIFGLQNNLLGTLDYILLIRALFVVSTMMVVFVVDLEHFLILDKVVLPAVFVVVVFNVLSDWVSGGSIFMFSSMTLGGLFSAVFLSGLSFLLWWVSDGRLIGFGDVKFLFLMGLILGFPLGFLGFFISVWIGTIVSLVLIVLGKQHRKSLVPFGTYLSAGVLITMLYGEEFMKWYFALLA